MGKAQGATKRHPYHMLEKEVGMIIFAGVLAAVVFTIGHIAGREL